MNELLTSSTAVLTNVNVPRTCRLPCTVTSVNTPVLGVVAPIAPGLAHLRCSKKLELLAKNAELTFSSLSGLPFRFCALLASRALLAVLAKPALLASSAYVARAAVSAVSALYANSAVLALFAPNANSAKVARLAKLATLFHQR